MWKTVSNERTVSPRVFHGQEEGLRRNRGVFSGGFWACRSRERHLSPSTFVFVVVAAAAIVSARRADLQMMASRPFGGVLLRHSVAGGTLA
jgi:hypothetical protein